MSIRFERKYILTRNQADYLISTFSSLFHHDPHSHPVKGYIVTSLYFDSKDFKAFYEKEEGEYYKEKWRLRRYDGKDEIQLEQKIKLGHKSQKTVYKEYQLELAALSKEPKMLVCYRRHAFFLSALRLTVDVDLSFSRAVVIDDIHRYIPDVLSDICILEIKSQEDILNNVVTLLIQKLNLKATAFSKYAHGVKEVYGI